MGGIRGELLQGVVSLLAAVGAFLFAPVIAQVAPAEGLREIVTWILFVVTYALLLLVAYIVGGLTAFRRLYDPRAKFIGDYVSGRPGEKSGTVGFFTIRFDAKSRAYCLNGTTVDLKAPDRPGGSWSSTTMTFDVSAQTLNYIYTGKGKDSRAAGADGDRELGFAVMDFSDDKCCVGDVHFRDDHRDALYVETQFRRLDGKLVREHLGKKSKVRGYEDMRAFALSFSASAP